MTPVSQLQGYVKRITVLLQSEEWGYGYRVKKPTFSIGKTLETVIYLPQRGTNREMTYLKTAIIYSVQKIGRNAEEFAYVLVVSS
jgi:hypothetical protein